MQQKMQQWKITLEDWWKINSEEQQKQSKRYYMPFVLLFCAWIMIGGIKVNYTIQTTKEAVKEAVTEAVTEVMTDVTSKEMADEMANKVAKILADSDLSGNDTNRVLQDEINKTEGKENSKETTVKNTTETIETVKTTKVFKEPEETSEVLVTLGPEEQLTLKKEIGKGWLSVTHDRTKTEGYIYYYPTNYKEGDKVTKRNKSVKGKIATTTKMCSLLENPGITSKSVKLLSKGSKIKLISYNKLIKGEKYGWYKVKLEDSNAGYIYGDAISIEKTTENATKGVIITMQKAINMYEEPKETAKVVTTVQDGEKLTVTAETNQPGWLAVKGKDCEGYVYYMYTDYAKKAHKKEEIRKEYNRTYGVISGRQVNLRSLPEITAEVKDCLSIGTEVTILSQVEVMSGEPYGWYYIQLKNGQDGYVHGRYVEQGERAKEIKMEIVSETSKAASSSETSEAASSNQTSEAASSSETSEAASSNQTSEATISSYKTSGSKAEYQNYAKQLCEEQYGWGEDQFNCLINLWNNESGWDPTAKNASSGAYGIPQALPASKIDAVGDRTDYRVQIQWGLSYIKNRYTNPAGAWAHFCEHQWY